MHIFVTCRNVSRSVCVCVCVCLHVYVYIDVQETSRMTGFSIRAHTSGNDICVYVCVRARSLAQWSVGRSAFVGEKSLSFPHNQGAASHTSVRAYFYIHSRGTREVRIIRPAGRKKKTPAECILRNDSTVSSSKVRLPPSFVLAPFRGNSFADASRIRENPNCRLRKIRLTILFTRKTNANLLQIFFSILSAGNNECKIM